MILRLEQSNTEGTSLQEEPDAWTKAVAEMISSLVADVQAVEYLSYPFVFLSVPNIILNHQNPYLSHFCAAVKQAGVQELRPAKISIFAAMEYWRIDYMNFGDTSHPKVQPVPDIKKVAVIGYSSTALETTLLERDDFQLLSPTQVGIHVDKGAEAKLRKNNSTEYWSHIRSLIKTSIEAIDVMELDRLILLGDQATDVEFLRVIEDIFKPNQKLRCEDYRLSAVDHTFVPARGMAEMAQIGMQTGFQACLYPDYCPRPDEQDGKDEL
jgi:hypothetical protein